MKKSRIFLTIITLTLVLLVFTGCKGVVPPSPGATEDVTVISGRIKMPLTCCAPLEGMPKDDGSNNDCDEVEFWPLIPNAVVELKSAAKGKCKTVLATTLTDEDGNYVFEDVKPGLYIITAYCPEEGNNGFFLKDVAEKFHGVALDAGIPDCTSTALALVIEKVNNCYNDWYQCYHKRTAIYKLIETIAKDVGKVDIAAIMNHDRFGDYCDDVYVDLVDLICDFGCCDISPGTTGGGGSTPDPCEGHTAPYDVALDEQVATVGEVYTGTVTAKDDDDDVLTFAFAPGYEPPVGMTINPTTGVITWDSPTVDDICYCEVPQSADLARIAAPQMCKPLMIIVSDRCHSTPAEFCLAVVDAPRYNVYYDGNGNTGGNEPIDSNSYYEGDDATVLGKNTLEKTNHTFTGWNTKADGTGDDYAADGTLTMPAADVTLYAQWTENETYNVYYDVNHPDGTGSQTDSNDYYEGDTVTVKDEGTMIVANHTFSHWNTAADNSGTDYNPAVTFAMGTADVTLYAQWEEIIIPDYTLILNVNPEAGGTVSGAGVYSAETIADISATANPGYKFTGWTVNKGSDSNVVDTNSASTDVTMNEDMTLTANFVPDIYEGDGTLTVAYEDMPEDKTSDYDYNDWVVGIKITPDYEDKDKSPNILGITFDFTPKARGAGHDHEFHIKIPANIFSNNGKYDLVITGDEGSINNGTFNANADMVFKVIPDTRRSLDNETGNTTNTVETSDVSPTVTAKLTITFDTALYYDFGQFDPYSVDSMHGEGLFFDPYIKVKPKTGGSYEVHRLDDRILTVPDDWKWPEEGKAVWKVYDLVSEGSAPTYVPNFSPAWWQGGHNDCVYGDGVTCPF